MSSTSSEPVRPRFTTGYLIAEGALLVILGAAAVGFPVLASVATAVLVGWILIASGAIGLASAFAHKPHVHFQWSLLSSALAIVAGLVVVILPLAGVITLVIVTAAWLALDGVSSLMIGLHARKLGRKSWHWSIVSAVIDWVLALGLIAIGPIAGIFAVGIVIGLDLMLGGLALFGLASHPHPEVEAAET